MESTDHHTSSALKDDLEQCIQATMEMEGQISGTSSAEYQKRVKETIHRLENITRQVSQLDMFSENESLDELSPLNLRISIQHREDLLLHLKISILRFLMLPALLACLNDKLTSIDRRTNLDSIEVYIRDFIKRLKSYGILPASSYQFNVDPNVESSSQAKARSEAPSTSTAEYLTNAIRNRDEKMKLYREQQEYKEKYVELSNKFDNGSGNDDEFLKNFFIVEMNYWARKLYELYINIEREKPLLEHMAKIEAGEIKPELESDRPPPSKPIILTRCKLQKEVFGLGYPSISTMTVDEFYEEKSKEGQIQALNNFKGESITEEDEDMAKERARDNDDDELIRSERDFDEYKDEHRRGWGNTYNKG